MMAVTVWGLPTYLQFTKQGDLADLAKLKRDQHSYIKQSDFPKAGLGDCGWKAMWWQDTRSSLTGSQLAVFLDLSL